MSTKKTQTFWAFTAELNGKVLPASGASRACLIHTRRYHIQYGRPVSPIVRIELPLPTKRKKKP